MNLVIFGNWIEIQLRQESVGYSISFVVTARRVFR